MYNFNRFIIRRKAHRDGGIKNLDEEQKSGNQIVCTLYNYHHSLLRRRAFFPLGESAKGFVYYLVLHKRRVSAAKPSTAEILHPSSHLVLFAFSSPVLPPKLRLFKTIPSGVDQLLLGPLAIAGIYCSRHLINFKTLRIDQ